MITVLLVVLWKLNFLESVQFFLNPKKVITFYYNLSLLQHKNKTKVSNIEILQPCKFFFYLMPVIKHLLGENIYSVPIGHSISIVILLRSFYFNFIKLKVAKCSFKIMTLHSTNYIPHGII